MSITVTTDVFCDAPSCLAWIDGVTDARSNAVDARARARRYGWTRKRVAGRMVDMCPEHTDDEPFVP